jgi:paraquat-inducible protein A
MVAPRLTFPSPVSMNESNFEPRDRLWSRLSPAWRWSLLSMIVVALSTNVAALLVPFLEMKEAFHASLTYELPAAVRLMWREGLPVVAVLILVFSIIFPLTKLVGLTAALLLPFTPRRRATLVRWLAILGRWSLLDVFVVMLLMVLASGQWAISTEVRPGVQLFMIAIGIAMTVAELMCSFESRHEPSPASAGPATMLARSAWWARISIPILLLGAASALTLALVAPVLRIHQFLLSSNSYSIGTAVETLWREQQILFALLMAVLLGGLPAARLLMLAGACLLPIGLRASRRLAAVGGLVGRFAALEVFGLALFLVLLEGRDLIRTEIEAGAWFLLAAIALDAAFVFVARRVFRVISTPSGEPAS